MPRAYRYVGTVSTEPVDGEGWYAVGGARFTLPWGTDSPLHLHHDKDYLVRWDEASSSFQIFERPRA